MSVVEREWEGRIRSRKFGLLCTTKAHSRLACNLIKVDIRLLFEISEANCKKNVILCLWWHRGEFFEVKEDWYDMIYVEDIINKSRKRRFTTYCNGMITQTYLLWINHRSSLWLTMVVKDVCRKERCVESRCAKSRKYMCGWDQFMCAFLQSEVVSMPSASCQPHHFGCTPPDKWNMTQCLPMTRIADDVVALMAHVRVHDAPRNWLTTRMVELCVQGRGETVKLSVKSLTWIMFETIHSPWGCLWNTLWHTKLLLCLLPHSFP